MLVRVGTRGTTLARAQSKVVADALTRVASIRGLEITVEFELVRDDVLALREALVKGECDIAVHSLVDLPTVAAQGVDIVAIPVREDSREALCGPLPLDSLAPGSVVAATTALRISQLLALRPDLLVVRFRGSDEALSARLGQGFDAVVLPVACLKRLDKVGLASQIFDFEAMVPAPGQGALAIEMARGSDPTLVATVAALGHGSTTATVTAERAALGMIDPAQGGSVGAHARVEAGELAIEVRVLNSSGTLQMNERAAGPVADAIGIGKRAAHTLLGRGVRRLIPSA